MKIPAQMTKNQRIPLKNCQFNDRTVDFVEENCR